MVLKSAVLLLTVVAFFGPAWADGERGSRAEADAYATREAEAPALQEFSGGFLGGLLAAVVSFLSNAVQALVDLFTADEPEAAPSNDQGRGRADGLPVPA